MQTYHQYVSLSQGLLLRKHGFPSIKALLVLDWVQVWELNEGGGITIHSIELRPRHFLDYIF